MPQQVSKKLAKYQEAIVNLQAQTPGSIDIEQLRDTLNWVKQEHTLLGALPSSLRINKETLEITDLPEGEEFDSRVASLEISDALSADELYRISEEGPIGEAAFRIIIDTVKRHLLVRIAATRYSPWTQEVSGESFLVHNDLVTLRSNWDAEALLELRNKLEAAGVFNQVVKDERFGVPLTSLTSTNPDMQRQWVTDSCMAGLTQREAAPQYWARNLITNAGFQINNKNSEAVLKTLKDPRWYRDNGAEYGVAHIFLPFPRNSRSEGLRWDEVNEVPHLESLMEDPQWLNRKRLESQALISYWLTETLLAGALYQKDTPLSRIYGRKWGFCWQRMSATQRQYVIRAIQLCMIYLLAVEWDGTGYDFEAPSVSSWEEAPIRGGCASDTGFMVDAAKSLRRLLFAEEFASDSDIREIRSALLSLDYLDLPARLGSAPYADFRQRTVLDSYIEAGERKLDQMVMSPLSSCPEEIRQFENRFADSSLALLAAYFETFSSSRFRSAEIRFGIVCALERALMAKESHECYGMVRYGTYLEQSASTKEELVMFDSYLPLFSITRHILPGLTDSWYREYVFKKAKNIAGKEHLDMSEQFLMLEATRLKQLGSNVPQSIVRDTTDAVNMASRQENTLPEWSAQWSIAPTACIIALARAKLELLEETRNAENCSKSKALLSKVNEKLSFFINLCTSTVVQDRDSSGTPTRRADGTGLPKPYNVMEAFQVCLDVCGNLRWLPGDHTLPWSSSQLNSGLRLAHQAASLEEKLV